MADAKFLTGRPLRHVTVMSLTSSLGLVAVFAVDFVDMIFIAMLGQAELAAAIGYAGAIGFFTASFGIGVAIAAGALVARALGRDDVEEARDRAASALAWGAILGAVFAALVWLAVPSLVSLVGARGETAALATGYLRIIVPSLPLLILGMVGGAILRAHGAAAAAMTATLAGAGVNLILDPILIFGLNLDLTGAALATVGARAAIGGVALWQILRAYGLGRPRLLADIAPLAAIGGPAVATQLATPVGQAIVTRAMAEFGEAAVAAMAVIARLTPVAFGTLFALSGAIGPIIGQNAGAGQGARVRATFRDGLIFAAAVTVVVSALLFAARPALALLFDLEGEALALVFLFAGPLSLLFFFNGVIFVSNAACNNLGRPLASTAVNWGRHTLGTAPFVIVGAAWAGAAGVLIGQALGGVAFALIAWIIATRAMAEPGTAPRGPFAREGRLMAIWHGRR
ncbi:MAG: MATE family efflux transporter [Paracoccaceae bacterium]